MNNQQNQQNQQFRNPQVNPAAGACVTDKKDFKRQDLEQKKKPGVEEEDDASWASDKDTDATKVS